MNKTEKYWVGDNFFDFYFRHYETWWGWGSVAIAYVLSMIYLMYAFNDVANPEALALKTDLLLMMAVLSGGIGFMFTVFNASTTRSHRLERNEMLRKAENSEPIPAKCATRALYGRITEGLDPNHTLVLKTQLGNKEVKVRDLPDNRINLPSLKELFSSDEDG
jgi:hypothetical protein